MESIRNALCMAIGVVSLAGCVSPPSGPTVMAMPGTGKNYEQFKADDEICQAYARQNTYQGGQQASNNVAGNVAAGTLVGAASGALIGAASHNAGQGAAVGAGVGLLVGSSMGNNTAWDSNRSLQQRYNAVYTQCMYAKGNQVPVPAEYAAPQQQTSPVPPDYIPDGAVPPDYQP